MGYPSFELKASSSNQQVQGKANSDGSHQPAGWRNKARLFPPEPSEYRCAVTSRRDPILKAGPDGIWGSQVWREPAIAADVKPDRVVDSGRLVLGRSTQAIEDERLVIPGDQRG